MYSIFSVAESVGSNSTTPLSSPYFTPAAMAFLTSSFSFFIFFRHHPSQHFLQVDHRSFVHHTRTNHPNIWATSFYLNVYFPIF